MSDHHHDQEPIAPRVLDAAAEGCEEARLLINRRLFLGMSATLGAWAFAPRIVRAADPGDEPRLLVVVLRGGMDGLSVMAPTRDLAQYEKARGTVAVDVSRFLDLDGEFGLNPLMPKFHATYRRGDAALVHAIAPPLCDGSHFDSQLNLEAGVEGRASVDADGWMNKLLLNLPAGSPISGRPGLELGPAPFIISGEAPIHSWYPFDFGRIDGGSQLRAFDAGLRDLYGKTDPRLLRNLDLGLQSDSNARQTIRSSDNLSTMTALQKVFLGAGRLLAAKDGPRIAALSIDGWDSHAGQHALLSTRLKILDDALDDFRVAMGPAWSRTVVACVTEFGRTVAGNGRAFDGSAGTDHGKGTVALLTGGAVAGNQLHGEFPGLTNLDEGRHLKVTTDIRQMFKGILLDHLGVSERILGTEVFAESTHIRPMKGLIA